MKRRIRYEIDEVTGDQRETELGLVGNDVCQIEFNGSKLAQQLESLCDRAAASSQGVRHPGLAPRMEPHKTNNGNRQSLGRLARPGYKIRVAAGSANL